MNFGSATASAPGWLSSSVVIGLLRAADCLAVLVAGFLAFLHRYPALDKLDFPEVYAFAASTLLVANVFHFAGLYKISGLGELSYRLGRLLLAWTLVVLVLVAVAF